MGLLSKGITLSYDSDGLGAMLPLAGLQEIPELGGLAERVETTTLDDASRTYISGIKDFGELEFTFLYKNDSATDSYRVLSDMEVTGEATAFEINLPDGTKFAFTGQPSVRLNSVGVNAPLTFTAALALNTEITITHPA